MRAAIPYDSEEARSIAGYIAAVMHGVAYSTSAELAKKMGAIDGYTVNRDDMLRVVHNHHRAVSGQDCIGEMSQNSRVHYGIKLLSRVKSMDSAPRGVEPAFMLVVYKKLHGGGYMKLVDDSDPIAILYSLNEILVTGWSVVNDASS